MMLAVKNVSITAKNLDSAAKRLDSGRIFLYKVLYGTANGIIFATKSLAVVGICLEVDRWDVVPYGVFTTGLFYAELQSNSSASYGRLFIGTAIGVISHSLFRYGIDHEFSISLTSFWEYGGFLGGCFWAMSKATPKKEMFIP